MSKINLTKELAKISGSDAVKYWTADAAMNEYFLATSDELPQTKQIVAIIKKNLAVALTSKNPYIKTMALQIRDNPKGFQEGGPTFERIFPGLRKQKKAVDHHHVKIPGFPGDLKGPKRGR